MATDTQITLETLANPFVQIEAKRETARLAEYKRHAQAFSGVRHSGEPSPFTARTLSEIVADGLNAQARAKAFAGSPRGRFLSALRDLEETPNCATAADRLRGIYARSLADERQPLNVRAVGAALTILNGLDSEATHDLVDCLAELLINSDLKAA